MAKKHHSFRFEEDRFEIFQGLLKEDDKTATEFFEERMEERIMASQGSRYKPDPVSKLTPRKRWVKVVREALEPGKYYSKQELYDLGSVVYFPSSNLLDSLIRDLILRNDLTKVVRGAYKGFFRMPVDIGHDPKAEDLEERFEDTFAHKHFGIESWEDLANKFLEEIEARDLKKVDGWELREIGTKFGVFGADELRKVREIILEKLRGSDSP